MRAHSFAYNMYMYTRMNTNAHLNTKALGNQLSATAALTVEERRRARQAQSKAFDDAAMAEARVSRCTFACINFARYSTFTNPHPSTHVHSKAPTH